MLFKPEDFYCQNPFSKLFAVGLLWIIIVTAPPLGGGGGAVVGFMKGLSGVYGYYNVGCKVFQGRDKNVDIFLKKKSKHSKEIIVFFQ